MTFFGKTISSDYHARIDAIETAKEQVKADMADHAAALTAQLSVIMSAQSRLSTK